MSVKTAFTVTATFTASVLVAATAQAANLIVATGFPPSHSNMKDGLAPWEQCVTKATNGDLTFKDFPSGQISGHSDGTHSLKAGIAQIVSIPPAYESEKFPLNILVQLPGIGESAVHVTAAYRKMLDGDTPMAKELKDQGIRAFLVMLSAPYQIMSTGAPLDTMDKLKGKKIRTAAGPMTYAVEALGGTPIDMGTPDMYVGLQRGTIDGTILAMTSAPAYKLHEVVKSISTNGAFSSAHTLWAIDEKVYQGLSPAHQKAIMDCGKQVEKSSAMVLDEDAKKISADYASKGVKFYAFPPEMAKQIETSLNTVAAKFADDLEKRGLPAKKTYEMLMKAAKDTKPGS